MLSYSGSHRSRRRSPQLFRPSFAPLCAAIAGVVIMGCSRGDVGNTAAADTPLVDSAALAAADSTARLILDSTVAPTPFREGTWNDGGEQIAWRAWAHDGVLSQIDEIVTTADAAPFERRIRLDGNGSVMRIDERRTTLDADTVKASPANGAGTVTIRFANDSTVQSAERRVGNITHTLTPAEVTALQRHARAIREHIVTP